MADSRQRTLVSVRATCNQDLCTRVFARSSQAEFGVSFSFDREEPSLTVAENLLGLIAAEISGVFSDVCKQLRLRMDRLEVTATSELAASLRYLGVIGATGTPCYENFQIKVFVESPEPAKQLEEAWNEAVDRAPLTNTLKKSANVFIEWVIVD